MYMLDAYNIMFRENKKTGFKVSFEVKEESVLGSDAFPENGEELISSEKDAWYLARKFAEKADPSIVNIFVVDQDHRPVKDYDKKILRRH